MKITLDNSLKLDLKSLEDLESILPKGLNGEAINYGQGEGQIEIQNSLWGLYVEKDGNYQLVFEEGKLELDQLISIVQGIISKIQALTGVIISPTVSSETRDAS